MRKHYRDIQLGDIVRTHGLDFVVTQAPQSYESGGRTLWYFIGTYNGPDLAADHGMAPFVQRAGDEWTFQRAEGFAWAIPGEDRKLYAA